MLLFALQNGETALMLAAAGGHVRMIEFLLRKGADINAMDVRTSFLLKENIFCYLILKYLSGRTWSSQR